MIHPDKLQDRIKNLLRGKVLELSRCVKACFLGEDGKPTLEAQRAIADWRQFAYLGRKQNAFLRDLGGRIDPLSVARVEGRREMFNRMIEFLELDPSQVRAFVEVDNGRE